MNNTALGQEEVCSSTVVLHGYMSLINFHLLFPIIQSQ